MRARQHTALFSILGLVLGVATACGNNNGTSKSDGATDGRTDGAKIDVASDTSTDAPIDQAQTDGGAAADAADAADADGTVASDASDGGDAPVTATQKLVRTIIVTDQIGGDGGLEVAPSDAAATEAGAGDAPGGVTVDPHVVNPWGLAFDPSGSLWVADNFPGASTIYSATGQMSSLIVTIPVPPSDGGATVSAPSGLVFNGTAAAFMGDKFIFSTEDGTIAGWQAGAVAVLRVDNSSATDAFYKGLALGMTGGAARLFATDFHNGKVDAFDQTYAKVTTAGGFTDPTLPAGFAPFGIQVAGGAVWVTYAKQDDKKEDDVSGAGNGYVDVFDLDGHFTRRAISQGALNSPWGLAVAPADFGAFSNALLVGNFGDGHINAYNATTGALLGSALDPSGAPLAIEGLWALVFGNDTPDAPHTRLFFTAGPSMENHGLVGHLDLP